MQLKFHIDEPFDRGFSVAVNVNQEGIFTCTLPVEIAALFTGKIRLNAAARHGSRPGYFSDKTLEGLKTQIGAKLKELVSAKVVKKEKILRFAIETTCSYSMTPDGDFMPIASHTREWRDGTVQLSSMDRRPFGLRMYAKPFWKRTYRYEATGTERVEYTSCYEHGASNDVKDLTDDPCAWLSNMHSCSSTTGGWSTEDVATQEIPYTDEAARFFVGLFKWLFSVNERIKPFLNPEGIMQLAQMRAFPQLGPANEEKSCRS